MILICISYGVKPVYSRILVGLILALIGMALFLGIDLNRSGRARVLQEFNATQLVLAQEAAHEAELSLMECSAHLGTLARLASVQRGDAQRMAGDLKLYAGPPEASRHATLMMINPEGKVMFPASGMERADFRGSELLEWSKLKKNQGSVLVSAWSKVAGITNAVSPGVAIVATPLYQSGWDSGTRRSTQSWSGVLLMTVDLGAFLAEHLAPLSPNGKPVRIWIMDEDGSILLQSEHPEMARENIFRPQLQCAQCHVSFDYARNMLTGKAGTTEYQLKNQPKRLAAFVPLQVANASWVLVLNAPYDEVTAFVSASYRKTMWFLGTVVLAFGLASLLVYQANLSRVRAKQQARHWQEKLHLEEHIRRTEEQYRTLFEQSPNGILMLDPDTLLPLTFNEAAHQQLGYSREEFAQTPASTHAGLGSPEDMKALFARLLRSGTGRFEIEQRTRQGTLRTFEVIARTLKLPERTVLHCIYHDLTERKQVEDAMTGRSAQLEALHQASLSITAEMETGVLLNTIVQKSLALFRGCSACLFLQRLGSEELEWVVNAGGGASPQQACLKKGQSLAGRCWETGAPLVVTDRESWEAGQPRGARSSWTAAMAAPLRWGDVFLGVLEIHSDTAGFFSRDDAVLLGLFATQAAIAVKNAGLLERVRRDDNIKTTLLHDVSHRVKNNLARLLEIVRLERERMEPAAVGCHAALTDLEDRMRGMELVHRMLSTSQWQPLPLRDLLTQIVAGALSGSPIRERIRVSVLTPSNALEIVPEQATAIALILSELTTNSAKHAFDKRAEGRLEVQLQIQGESKGRPLVRLRYRDDGPGWPDEVLTGNSRHVGMRLIQASVRSPLRGELSLRNEDGAVAEIAFKLALTA